MSGSRLWFVNSDSDSDSDSVVSVVSVVSEVSEVSEVSGASVKGSVSGNDQMMTSGLR
jgi:hypothetical protein